MMPIGKTITVMDNEEKINVVWEMTTEKISFVPAGCDDEKIGVVLEKVGVCPRFPLPRPAATMRSLLRAEMASSPLPRPGAVMRSLLRAEIASCQLPRPAATMRWLLRAEIRVRGRPLW